ncbi:MAG: HD domain-containing protein [Peptococcaceae bacterium]|nr:HD domain-containing protein [Peptococcaceae bacterium]
MKELAPVLTGPEAAELILESIPNPVIMINNDSTILYINKSMESFLKADRCELVGKPLVEALYKGLTLTDGYHNPVLETLITGKEFSNRPVEIKTIFNVTPRPMLISTFLIKDGEGRVAGACAFFTDNPGGKGTVPPFEPPSKRLETVYAFAEAIGARDGCTMGHSEKVAQYAKMIAERMGQDKETVEQAYLCGMVHDVGKIGIPESVLNKEGPLTGEEYELIMGHSRIGANILARISWLNDIVPIVEAHHERYNGNGYPMGLKGDQIPVLSRILAVADAFDAMTSDRSYRKAFSLEKAVGELKRNAGTQFDPEVVDVFIDLLKEYS